MLRRPSTAAADAGGVGTAAQRWLREHGEPSGEQALADRIKTTCHQMRDPRLGAEPPEPVADGHTSHATDEASLPRAGAIRQTFPARVSNRLEDTQHVKACA